MEPAALRSGRQDSAAAGGGGKGSRRVRSSAGGIVVAAILLFLDGSTRGRSFGGSANESPHVAAADCFLCHTADSAGLAHDPAMARSALVSGIEETCNGCHADEGPSHKTGMPPRAPLPAALPLSPEGMITCSTCHFVHGEAGAGSSWLRIDNRRGELCLTCHTMADLE